MIIRIWLEKAREDAAEGLFADKGYANTSLEDIGERVGGIESDSTDSLGIQPLDQAFIERHKRFVVQAMFNGLA